MNKSLQIKTIQYFNIPVKTRYLFLKHLQRNVHEFALNRQDEFLAAGNTAEHFHKDKGVSKGSLITSTLSELETVSELSESTLNGTGLYINQSGALSEPEPDEIGTIKKTNGTFSNKKCPALIHGFEQNGFFALRAYTQAAIRSLDQYQQLLGLVYPEWTENCIVSIENCTLKRTSEPLIYQSDNWLPYRDCELKNGVFYDKEKNKIASFDNRIKGNMGSFLRSISCGDELVENIKKDVQIIQLSPQKRTTPALLIKDQEIKKYAFRMQIRVQCQFPQIFSLGQNAAFGNGVFKRVK